MPLHEVATADSDKGPARPVKRPSGGAVGEQASQISSDSYQCTSTHDIPRKMVRLMASFSGQTRRAESLVVSAHEIAYIGFDT
jgi:hypothetical protein